MATTITTTTKSVGGRTTAATTRALKAANIIPTGRGTLDSGIASFVGAVKSAEASSADAMRAIYKVYNGNEWTLVNDGDGKPYKSWTAFYDAVIGPSGIPVKTATLYLRAVRVTEHAIPDTATPDAVDGWNRLKNASPSVVKNLAALFVQDDKGNNVLAGGQEGVYNRMGLALKEMDTITARNVEAAYRDAKNPDGTTTKAKREAVTKATENAGKPAVKAILDKRADGDNIYDMPQIAVPVGIDSKSVDGVEYRNLSLDMDTARSFAGEMFRALNEIGRLPAGTLTDVTVRAITTACALFSDIARAFDAPEKPQE